MTKKLFLLSAVFAATVANAQDLDDVKKVVNDKNINAKETVDKYLSNPKNASKADGWYYKAFIYNNLSKDSTLSKSCADCGMEAFEAVKKYQSMDKNNFFMMANNNALLFDIYNNYFDAAVKGFNSKDYATAVKNFKGAGIVEEYVSGKGFDYNGFKFPAFDTSLILNTAVAARLAKNDEDAYTYYKKIADANIGGSQYVEVYQFLVENARDKKDKAALAAAIAQGKKLYPDDPYWTAVEMEEISANSTTKQETFNKYEELFQANSTNYTIGYNYAVELYNYLYANTDKVENAEDNKARLKQLLKKVIAIKSTPEANMLMARLLYNSSFDNSDEAKKVKGVKPEDVKKKKALNDAATADMNETIPYAEEVVKTYGSAPSLKAIEKANYKVTLGMLKDIYGIKKDAVKTAEYDKKIKDLEN